MESEARPEASNEAPEVEQEDSLERFVDHLDKRLDEHHDTEMLRERMNNPYIRWSVISLIVLLFLIFALYASSFIFGKEIPQAQELDHFVSSIVETLKLFLD